MVTSDRLGRAAVAWGLPALVAVIVIVNAAGGLMPGVGYWDTGEFQTILPILGTAHPTGYPTYVIIGFVANLLLTPFGEPAFRINVLSLLAVAVAAGVTVALVRRLTGSPVLGIAAGLGLAITKVVWGNASRADPHPIHLAFVAILLFVLVTWADKRRSAAPDADRWLVAAAVVFGLAVGNHSLTLLLAIPVALFVLATEPRIVLRGRLILAGVVALAATLVLVYLELPLRAGWLQAPLVYAHPDTWDGFWYIALAEQFRGSLSDPLGDLPGKVADVIDIANAQFGPLLLVLVPAFLATIRLAPRYALLTGSAMVITLLFNTSYSNADIGRYYLGPALWAWTWLALLAAFVAREVGARFDPDPDEGEDAEEPQAGVAALPLVRRRLVSASTVVGVVTAAALLAPGILASGDVRRAVDRSADIEAARFADATFSALAPNAVIVSWWATSTPLWYEQKVDRVRTDVFIVDDRTMLDQDLGEATDVIARYLGQRPVYVIRANLHDLGLVLDRYDLQQVVTPDGQPVGGGSTAVYEVIGPRSADVTTPPKARA